LITGRIGGLGCAAGDTIAIDNTAAANAGQILSRRRQAAREMASGTPNRNPTP
jgi:hypothetical protein